MLHRSIGKYRARFRGVGVWTLLSALLTVNFHCVPRIHAAEPRFLTVNSPFGTPSGDRATGISTAPQSASARQFSLLPNTSMQTAFGEQSGGTDLSLTGAAPQKTGGFLTEKSDLLSPDLEAGSARGDGNGMQTGKPKRGLRTDIRALAGFVAFDDSNSHARNLKSLTNCNVCSYGQAGEILIPTSTIAAGLGHIFGFHRAR